MPAERQRDDRHERAAARPSATATNHTSRPADTTRAARLSQCRAGSISGLTRDPGADSLRNATIEPGEGHGADEDAEEHLDEVHASSARASPDCEEGVVADEHRRQADEAVQHRDRARASGSSRRRRARQSPIAPPTAIATAMSSERRATGVRRTVERRARWSRRGRGPCRPCRRRCRPWPSRASRARRATGRRGRRRRCRRPGRARLLTSVIGSVLPEHLEHAAGHGEATEDVDARDQRWRGRPGP